MRQLIWKELREQRFVPVVYGVLTIAIIAAWYAASVWIANSHNNVGEVLTANTTTTAWALLICFAGVFSGSGAISGEVGKGTASFISVLPGGRKRLWLAKVIAGAVNVVLSMAAISVGYAAIVTALYGLDGLKPLTTLPTSPEAGYMLVALVVYSFFGYAVCLAASTLIDRALAAGVVGLVAGIGLIALVDTWIVDINLSYHPPRSDVASIAIVGFFGVACLVASYVGFCSGEYLTSRSRIRQAMGIVGSGLAGVIVILSSFEATSARAAGRLLADVQKNAPHMYFDQAVVPGGNLPSGGQAVKSDLLWPEAHLKVVFPPHNRYGINIGFNLTPPGHENSMVVNDLVPAPPRPDEMEMLYWGDFTVNRNEAYKGMYDVPLGARVTHGFTGLSMRNSRRWDLRLARQTRPGVYHDTIWIVDKANRHLGQIDVENVTQ